jgi:hypothetical protein
VTAGSGSYYGDMPTAPPSRGRFHTARNFASQHSLNLSFRRTLARASDDHCLFEAPQIV